MRYASSSTFSKSAVTATVGGVKHATKISLAHPKRLAVIAGTGGAAAASGRVTQDHRKTDDARAAAAGGTIGWGLHQAGPYPVKWQARHQVKWNARMSDLETGPEKKTIQTEQKSRGRWQRAHKEAGTWNNPASKMYRDFPADHRRARTFRTFGYTHGGRLGEAASIASTGAGAAVAVHVARKRQDGSHFSKRHHGLQAASGLGLIAISNPAETGQLVNHIVAHDPPGQRLVAEIKTGARSARGALAPSLVHNVAEATRRYPILKNKALGTALGVGMLVRASRSNG